MTSVDQHCQLNSRRPPIFEKSVDRSADRPPRVEHVVDEDDGHPLDRKRDARSADERLASRRAAAVADVLRRHANLRELLDDLPPKEREILLDRFGLGSAGEAPLTLEAIGQRMGITRERVRQIEAAALQKLRRRLQARGIEWPGA